MSNTHESHRIVVRQSALRGTLERMSFEAQKRARRGPPMLVRELLPRDRARWEELWGGYLDFYKQTLSPRITELTWQRLTHPTHPLCGIVAVDDMDCAIGLAHYQVHSSTWSLRGYCYLEDLFVDSLKRARGAGRALIEAVYRVADQQGVDRVYWHTEATNTRAQVLYHQVAELTTFVQFRRRC